MKASKHVGKLLLIVLAGLLSVPSVTAEQRERTRANTSASASKSEKQSSKKTQGSAFERLQQLFKEAKEAGRQSKPIVEIEEKGDTIVFKHLTPFGLRTWTKNRSLLTPKEQELLRTHQAKQAEAKQAQGEADEQQEPSQEATPVSVEPQQIDSTDDQR